MAYGLEIYAEGQVFYSTDTGIGDFFLSIDVLAVDNASTYNKTYSYTSVEGNLRYIAVNCTHLISTTANSITATTRTGSGSGYIVVFAQ